MALREELTTRLTALIQVESGELKELKSERLKELKSERLPRWAAILLAILLSPLFIVSGLMTIPLWSMWLVIQHKVKDRAFHNSVQYVWQLVFMTITLLIPLPFWLFVQEYIFQLKVEN